MGSAESSLRWLGAAVFTVLVPGTVTVFLPAYLMPGSIREIQAPWWLWLVAGTTVLGGGVVYLRCLWDFVRRGRGLPAPLDHPKHLVVDGLYRYVRNPMYVGVLLVLVGELLVLGSIPLLWYSVAWFAVVNAVILLYEEPYLEARFGESHAHYRRHVGRWLPGRPYPPHAEEAEV